MLHLQKLDVSCKRGISLLLNICHCKSLTYTTSTSKAESDLLAGFSLSEDFISQHEEQAIVTEVNPTLLRRKYNKGHWDNAIVLFRETEKSEWNEENYKIMKRFEEHVFGIKESYLPATHVLDLSEDGYIKPHIDSVKFCGPLVSGLSLLSDSVMRLRLDEENYADVFIPRLSVYIMSKEIRYQYTHEILANPATIHDQNIHRTRRITVMKRSKEF